MGDSCYQTFGFIVFWLIVFLLTYRILIAIFRTLIAPSLGFGHKWKVADNYWAVVTGSTDGIGLEYAKELAKKGYNLLLLSRSDEKLKTTSELIKEKCGKCKEIRTLAVDFSKTDIYDKIKSELSKIDHIEVLVNNVGVSYSYPEYFHKIENRTELVNNLINVNMVSTSRLIDLILPRMVTQKSGVIINVSSLSGSCPSPLLSVYGATKTYVDFLSRALHAEYSDKGLIIQSVIPGLVCSKLSKISRPSLMVPSANTYVRAALATVGIESRTYGYWSHKVQGYLADELVGKFFGAEVTTKFIFNNLNGFRKRYYKKNGLKED